MFEKPISPSAICAGSLAFVSWALANNEEIVGKADNVTSGFYGSFIFFNRWDR